MWDTTSSVATECMRAHKAEGIPYSFSQKVKCSVSEYPLPVCIRTFDIYFFDRLQPVVADNEKSGVNRLQF